MVVLSSVLTLVTAASLAAAGALVWSSLARRSSVASVALDVLLAKSVGVNSATLAAEDDSAPEARGAAGATGASEAATPGGTSDTAGPAASATTVSLPAPAAVVLAASPPESKIRGGAAVATAMRGAAVAAVRITKWNANLGNNLAQLMHAFWFAKVHEAKMVELPGPSFFFEQVKAGARSQPILNDRLRLALGHLERVDPSVRGGRHCDSVAGVKWDATTGIFSGRFWPYQTHSSCPAASPQQHRAVMQEYVRKLLSAELGMCLREMESEEDVLTIHLRGGDLFQGSPDSTALPQLWWSPPCSMYSKIISEEGYRRVLLITSPDRSHPCLEWLQAFKVGRSQDEAPVQVSVQSASLLEDVCKLMSAQNLVLAYSTLSETLALLSERVRRLYGRTEFNLFRGQCLTLPGVALKQYGLQVDGRPESHARHGKTLHDARQWMMTFPAEEIHGPRQCRG